MTELVPNIRYQKLGTGTKNQAGEVLVPALLVRSTNKGPGTSTNLLGFGTGTSTRLGGEA